MEGGKPRAVDLFAGPGGWDSAAAELGLDPLGIEWDDAACKTRAAAGLRTRQADVAALAPEDFAPCDLLLASPPCQAFSRAGKREGIEDLPHVYEAALALAEGRDPKQIEWRDDRAALVIEPLRWALALEPSHMAWEQVPDVLPFWRYCSGILEAAGWWTWTGVLEAERFGVPQTRERAILMASREGHVEPPRPTHQRYVKGVPQQEETTLEGTILPWVSMAEALGWAEGEQPSPAPTVTSGGGKTGGVEVFASQAARDRAKGAVRTNNFSAIARDPDGERSKAGSVPYERSVGHPAPTLDTHVQGWVYDRRQGSTKENGERVMARPIPASEPAPTIAAAGLAKGRDVWVHERPATTVAGDPRIFPGPRAERDPDYQPGDEAVSQANPGGSAIRVSLEEAATLQTFPPDYPFQGSRTAKFTQVGNAVPPLLARSVLTQLLGIAVQTESREAA